MYKLICSFAAATTVVVALACSDSKISNPSAPRALPEPVAEANHPIPDDPHIYFKAPGDVYYHPNREAFRAAMEAHVKEVMATPSHLTQAWIPIVPDICMAMGSITVLIIEVENPSTRLAELGWLDSPPGWWMINCGVDSLLHYRFDTFAWPRI